MPFEPLHEASCFGGGGIIHGGVAIREFDKPQAFERRDHHEQIGRAVTLYL
jgi:hypothetical protein